MNRSLALVAAFCALGAPAFAQDQSSMLRGGLAGDVAETQGNPRRQWVLGINQSAHVYEAEGLIGLKVTCRVADGYAIWLAVPNGRFGANENPLVDQSDRLDRFFEGVSVMQLTAFDRDGGILLTLPFTLWRDGSRYGWRASLDAAALDAVRAASHFDLQTNRWAARFTGNRSSAAIGEIVCAN